MFQKKIDELFSNAVNILGIVDGILIADFDEWGKNHNEKLEESATGVQAGKCQT